MTKILCVDFDGVIHSYISGWQGADEIPDPPVMGAMKWLADIIFNNLDYSISIYSSRSKEPEGIKAMKEWMRKHIRDTGYDDDNCVYILGKISYPTQKPPAYLTIDDRAICFRGTFPSIQEMNNFIAWNK